jgi:pimeloyl-ACP methyl ester carboxylesterase
VTEHIRRQPALTGVRHRYVDVGGLRMHVAEAGRGEPLVLLHGWPQHWYCFHRIIPRLAESFRLVVPDLRGFGWSDAPRGRYTKQQLAEDILALMRELGIDRYSVAGHDWGGIIAYLMAIAQPGAVRQVVALNTGHPWVRASRDLRGASTAVRSLPYQSMIAAPVTGRHFVRSVMVPLTARSMCRAGTWTQTAARSYAAQFEERARVAATVRLYRTFLTVELPRWGTGALGDAHLDMPVMAIHGCADQVLRPSILDGLHAHISDLRIEKIPEADHFVCESAPHTVSSLLEDFLTH